MVEREEEDERTEWRPFQTLGGLRLANSLSARDGGATELSRVGGLDCPKLIGVV